MAFELKIDPITGLYYQVEHSSNAITVVPEVVEEQKESIQNEPAVVDLKQPVMEFVKQQVANRMKRKPGRPRTKR